MMLGFVMYVEVKYTLERFCQPLEDHRLLSRVKRHLNLILRLICEHCEDRKWNSMRCRVLFRACSLRYETAEQVDRLSRKM